MANWKKKYNAQEAEKRKEALRQQVEGIINNFENSPENIVEYLKFNSKFHQYSVKNTMLIYEQNEFAQFCASYKAFQNMGYHVQKGQTGMKIFVPRITTVFLDSDTNQWMKLSEGTKEQKAKVKSGQLESKQYTSFGIGTVFDIGQTDCPPEDYPKVLDMGYASESHNRLYRALVNYAESQNISVSEKFLPTITARGYYLRSDHSITLSDKLNDSMKLSVMAHELSHAIMHSDDAAADLPQMQKEIEADSLSLMIRQHLGITDIEDVRQSHLQSAYKKYIEMANENNGDNEYPDLSEILDNVNRAYTVIIDDFDKSISNYLKQNRDISLIRNKIIETVKTNIINDALKYNSIDKLKTSRYFVSQVKDEIGKIAFNNDYELTVKEEKSILDEIFESNKNFSQTIDDFLNGKINPYYQVFVCETTEVMKACGVKDLNVVINQSSIKKILSDDKEKFPHAHNLSIQELKELPKQLQKPIMALKGSHENSVVFVTDIKDFRNNEILISVDIDTAGYKQSVNRVTSMYGKDNITNYLRTQLDNGNLIGCDKKRANQMLSTKGLQLPPATTFIDYTDIISDSDKNVNTEILTDSQVSVNSLHQHQLQQLKIIHAHNPAPNDYQTWIRNINDVKTFDETLKDSDFIGWEDEGFDESYSAADARIALEAGKITVYSSHPIGQGVFVSPSYMEAKNYSGNGKVYSKEVALTDIAWIDPTQGQYAAVNEDERAITKQLENTEELPIDVLCDNGKIQWYSFANGINNTEKVKDTLQKIQTKEKQVVSILSNDNIHQLVYINDELQLVPYSDHVFPSVDAALRSILENDNIAKLVPYETMLQASVEQDLTVLSKCTNQKYPFVKINWSDNTELAQEGCLPLDKAEKLFTDINAGHDESLRQRTNLSLFLDGMNTYNLDVDLGAEPGGITDHLNQLINDSDISSDKSMQHLQEYLKEKGLLDEQELQLEQAKQMNLFDYAEIT